VEEGELAVFKPKTIQDLTRLIARNFGSGVEIDINARASQPRVGTHRRQTKRIPRHTHIAPSIGLTRWIGKTKTVAELKSVLSQHVWLRDEALTSASILVFGPRNRLLNGNIHWRDQLDGA
jgi:hypothetical protein